MKNHIIVTEVSFADLDKTISKYEEDGYEVAGITWREYHYDIIFKHTYIPCIPIPPQTYPVYPGNPYIPTYPNTTPWNTNPIWCTTSTNKLPDNITSKNTSSDYLPTEYISCSANTLTGNVTFTTC